MSSVSSNARLQHADSWPLRGAPTYKQIVVIEDVVQCVKLMTVFPALGFGNELMVGPPEFRAEACTVVAQSAADSTKHQLISDTALSCQPTSAPAHAPFSFVMSKVASRVKDHRLSVVGLCMETQVYAFRVMRRRLVQGMQAFYSPHRNVA